MLHKYGLFKIVSFSCYTKNTNGDYMEKIRNAFEVSPSTNIIGVLENSGYTLETAMADIVDNSIAAGANKIHVSFKINNSENDEVLIIDNGKGMSLQKMKDAAILAYTGKDEERDLNDLGRYSLGLKSASMSCCDRLYIVSKEKDCQPNTVIIDFDEIKQTKCWRAYEAEKSKYEDLIGISGTIIVWKKLKFIEYNHFDRSILNEKIASVESHFSHIYSDYIKNKIIELKIGKSIVEAWDPFMLSFDSTKIVSSNVITYKSEKIKVAVYILPVASSISEEQQRKMTGKGLSEQQGFYIYRNNRIISEGGWLGLRGMNIDNKSQYARIRIDITSGLDADFKVNFMKNSVEIPDALKPQFLEIAKKAKKESLHSYAYMKNPSLKRTRKAKDYIPVWDVTNTDKSISLSVNENHPIIIELTKNMPDKDRRKLFALLSRNLPVDRVQNNDFNEKCYSEQEIKQLIKETYESLENEGLSKAEIQNKMSLIEPFSQEIYFPFLIDFFNENGVD